MDTIQQCASFLTLVARQKTRKQHSGNLERDSNLLAGLLFVQTAVIGIWFVCILTFEQLTTKYFSDLTYFILDRQKKIHFSLDYHSSIQQKCINQLHVVQKSAARF